MVVSAQPPQLIPYQAIARDNSGNPVLNQNIGLRFSIHDQTINGAVVWQETQTVVSNNLGIIVTALGGTTQLTSVDWGSGAKFLKVEMDITGGTNYLDMGTQQMMSVPYALYAETSGSVINNGGGSGGNGSFTHWIGELYGGGIICHLWKDAQGIEHGLIASLVDLGYDSNTPPFGTKWYEDDQIDFVYSQMMGFVSSETDGQIASVFLSNQSYLNSDNPATRCENYSNQGFSDWYLPSFEELVQIWNNHFVLNTVLSNQTNAEMIGFDTDCTLRRNSYWSSTGGFGSWLFIEFRPNRCNSGLAISPLIHQGGWIPNNVRAIRKF